jgi:hypothetical protein
MIVKDGDHLVCYSEARKTGSNAIPDLIWNRVVVSSTVYTACNSI